MPNIVKVSREMWLETAKQALIKDGLHGVKIDRLAKTLGVTRGGFYHHFNNHKDLLERLLDHWSITNNFTPTEGNVTNPAEALHALKTMMMNLVREKDFSPAFEMAVREWARINPHTNLVVDKVDQERIEKMTDLFLALGCNSEEAPIRARVLYFHQIGYYSLGYHRRYSKEERLLDAPIYLKILCGQRYIEAAEHPKSSQP